VNLNVTNQFNFFQSKFYLSQVWWYALIIPALRRMRQEDLSFKACVDYLGRPCLHKKSNLFCDVFGELK
jgi:hypothetical protein